MGNPYSLDLRKRVVAAIEGGMSRNQAADQFGIAISTYFEKALLSVLRPGDIVVSDNLGSHRSSSPTHPFCRRQAVLAAEILARPDPIEQVFTKLKHLLRKAGARTVDAVCAAIGYALDAFIPEECANYLKNSGYRT